MSPYKVGILNTILSVLLLNGYSAQYCDENFNHAQCSIDIYCNGGVITQYSGEHYKVYNYNRDYLQGKSNMHCKTIEYSNSYNSFSVYQFYPLHLILNDKLRTYDGNSQIIPDFRGNMARSDILKNIMTYIDLRNNSYINMPTFNEMKNLAVVNLSNNSLNIAKLTNKYNLPALTEIDLSHNTINEIESNVEGEHTFIKLKKVNLSYNRLSVMPDTVFEPFKDLEILDLSNNIIENLNQIMFEGVKKLTHLNLSFNKISDLNSALFRFSELVQLDLSFNNITDIKARDFNLLTKIEILDMSNNGITSIERDTFGHMGLLKSLHLNNNKLINLDKDLFNNVSLLTDIDISKNNFNTLPNGLFKNNAIRNFSVADNQLEGSIDRNMFDGLTFVLELNLSHQHLESLGDDAFFGLNKIEIILLNNNNIKVLSQKCFKMLQTLKQLNLSFNQIETLDFEKVDLYNLRSLYLRNNNIKVVKHEYFQGLNSLQFLDLSDNKISRVEANSFQSLKDLINFDIANNPLSGVLKENTFDGLNSLPSLDISCTSIISIRNGSFNGMFQLKNFNVSHSNISSLEYNIFIYTGSIVMIDLSYNNLEEFSINSTELARTDKLYLNNNHIKTLDSDTFTPLLGLTVLSLSHNMIENITRTFANQKNLRQLDLSYNPLTVTSSLLNATKTVDILNLSGIKRGLSFYNIKDVSVTELTISNSSITGVKTLHINELQHLDSLVLSNNDIAKLDNDGFSNIKTLRFLDISYNKIGFIQSGAFKDNTLLYSLNVSHNFLSDISYGIFHGLIYLNTLDISNNIIRDLDYERFHEVKSLSVLIADHNMIESINAEEFLDTSLNYLSIGDNPIPCDMLVNLNRSGVPLHITASRLDFVSNENVNGISCIKKLDSPTILSNVSFSTSADITKVLLNIRDIMLNHYKSHETATRDESEKPVLDNINENIKKLTQIMNSTNQNPPKAKSNAETNVLLQKILKVLSITSARQAPTVEIAKGNATNENLVAYINKIKQELEASLAFEKDLLESKITALNNHQNANHTPGAPKHGKQVIVPTDSKSYFTETCVGLILVILVCFVLYKVYKSGIFVRQTFAASTRELPGAMDSSL